MEEMIIFSFLLYDKKTDRHLPENRLAYETNREMHPVI